MDAMPDRTSEYEANSLSLGDAVAKGILFLRYAHISFFCLLAGLGTLRLIYIIARNKCARECPVLFA